MPLTEAEKNAILLEHAHVSAAAITKAARLKAASVPAPPIFSINENGDLVLPSGKIVPKPKGRAK